MNNLRKSLIAGTMAGTALLGGAVGASLVGTAGAQTADSSTSDGSTTATPPTDNGATPAPQGPHTANGITEQELTGDDATQAIAAAQAAEPDATVVRAETDAEGAAYEVHMTRSDGTEITVKLDSSFTVTETVTGRG